MTDIVLSGLPVPFVGVEVLVGSHDGVLVFDQPIPAAAGAGSAASTARSGSSAAAAACDRPIAFTWFRRRVAAVYWKRLSTNKAQAT